MSLEDISRIIDEKMNNGNGKIVFTFYEVNLKYNFTKEDKQKFLRLAETKLENLGYKCYFEKQQYTYMGDIYNLQPNETMVAIRNKKKAHLILIKSFRWGTRNWRYSLVHL